VEQETGQTPPHGILQYRNRTFEIAYGGKQRNALLDLLEEIRDDARLKECQRSHEEQIRCQRCGFRHVCDQKL
jgi:CRISPR-associated exonuclease Cas4